MATIPCDDFIRIRQNEKIQNIYDVEMRHLDELRQYDSVECHIVLYPYSRKICSENIRFQPYEEYVKDILSHHKSAYTSAGSQFNKLFGIMIGLLITAIFFKFKPSDLFSVESIVSVFGSYFVGKEIWDDIERNLIEISKSWRLRYQENYYSYRLEKRTTLTNYSWFAKKQRYGKTPLLPEQMDFIEKSNSQTLRLYFNMNDVGASGSWEMMASSGHLFSLHLDPELIDDFEKDGFLLGVKFSVNKQFLGFTKRLELFQSLHRDSKGALDEHGLWTDNTVFYRKTLTCGRIKAFLKSGLLADKTIIA
ncbi:MAG: hypothetical protein GY801_43320 [bacterium]|nr:hypothetical protein [bacterium]